VVLFYFYAVKSGVKSYIGLRRMQAKRHCGDRQTDGRTPLSSSLYPALWRRGVA